MAKPPKMTRRQDDAADKRGGIKEGTRKDVALDKRRGVPDKKGR